jgi:hypothetical protein
VAAAAVAVVRNRAWASPNLAFMSAIAEHLGSNPFRGGLTGDYLLTNLLGPVVARAVGQTAPHELARLHLIVLVIGLAAALILAARRFGAPVACALAVVLAGSPAMTTTTSWLGQPDAFTLPLGLCMTLVRNRWVAFGLAVLAGLAHPEQALFLAAVAGVVRVALDGDGWPPWRRTAVEVAVLVGGVAVGRAVTEVYLRVNDIVVTQPRTSFLDLGWDGFLDHHGQAPAVMVFALWGPLWLAWLTAVVLRLGRSSGREAWRATTRTWTVLAVLAVVAVLPVAVTLDETRVYAMITSPLLVAMAVLLLRDLSVLGDRVPAIAGAMFLAMALVVPGVFTAGRAAWTRDLPPDQIVDFLRDGRHPGDDLTTWLLSPFDFVIPHID